MAQFDVVENRNPDTRHQVPYLLVLQADLFDDLATRVVAPLVPVSKYGPSLDWLNPSISIDDAEFVISTTELAGVPSSILGDRVCSAANHRSEVISALDFLFTGS
jgi:toxin CcdB